MKYEILLKVKSHPGSSFVLKYRTICRSPYEKSVDQVVDFAAHHHFYDFVVLVNELSDEGDFIRSIR